MVTTRNFLIVVLLLVLLGFPPHTASAMETEHDAPSEISSNECVILLHGFGRTRHAMKPLAARLEAFGYTVWNKGYPSTEKPISELVSEHVVPAVKWAASNGAEKIHFVTHSLGGILVRAYLQEHSLPAGSRIVMLSPPNKGSEVADLLKPFFLYKWLMGPAGQELGTSPGSVPNRLKPVNADIGVIAGTRSIEPWFSMIVPGQDDGKISVENAKLEEMNDFVTVKSTHPFIMRSRETIDQVIAYLKNGRFSR